MSYDGFTVIWILGAALMVVALLTLLGKKPGARRGGARRPEAQAQGK